MNLLLPPPVVLALIAAAMWGIDRELDTGRIAFTGQAPLAIALLAAGGGLMVAAVAAMFAARTTINPMKPARASKLVTGGVFRWSRNPIYLGDLLILAALAVWLGQIANLALLPAFVAYIGRFQILPEERALTARFGAEYAAYRARVRRWL
jgi:protein-S-isoprenylcysteine O-methyltransferase Ste14